MNTLNNIENILNDILRYENNTKYDNIKNRLNKVLEYYLYCLENDYNRVLNYPNIKTLMKEMSK